MIRVMVTGAGGFIGRQVVAALLAKGVRVDAVDRIGGEAPAGCAWHTLDLMDAAARREVIESVRPSHLVHLAWDTRHGLFWHAPENLDWVAATLDLARRFQACGGERLIAAGSCAEYAWTADALPDGVCREDSTPCRPATLYGTAKLATFQVLHKFAAGCGLGFAWPRLFYIFGAGEGPARLVPMLMAKLAAGEAVVLRHPDAERDVLDVRDLGEAIAALSLSSACGAVNVGAGEGVAIIDVARRIAALLGASETLIERGTPGPGDAEPPRLLADATRLRHEVGFHPRHPLNDALAEAIADWRQRSGG